LKTLPALGTDARAVFLRLESCPYLDGWRENKMDKFTTAYIAAALWSSNDESTPQGGEPLDTKFTAADIAPETLETMKADCAHFQAATPKTSLPTWNGQATIFG
jgi:hypothetical protein